MTDKEAPTHKIPEKRVSDIVPEGLWPDLPRTSLHDTLDIDIIIEDVAFLLGENGEFAVILYKTVDTGETYTVACGGMVVVRKLHDLNNMREFPILGQITKPGRYYDLG